MHKKELIRALESTELHEANLFQERDAKELYVFFNSTVLHKNHLLQKYKIQVIPAFNLGITGQRSLFQKHEIPAETPWAAYLFRGSGEDGAVASATLIHPQALIVPAHSVVQ